MTRQISWIDGEMVEWEVLPLVDQYDPILKRPTKPIDFENKAGVDIAYMSMSLMKSVEHYNGLGLAANQVGLEWSICAINHIPENKVYALINPVVLDTSVELVSFKEGCLSFPGLFLDIKRPKWVDIEFCAGNGELINKRFEGVFATCVLHEIDHLNGIVYTDLVSPIKLEIAKRKVAANIRKARHNS